MQLQGQELTAATLGKMPRHDAVGLALRAQGCCHGVMPRARSSVEEMSARNSCSGISSNRPCTHRQARHNQVGAVQCALAPERWERRTVPGVGGPAPHQAKGGRGSSGRSPPPLPCALEELTQAVLGVARWPAGTTHPLRQHRWHL